MQVKYICVDTRQSLRDPSVNPDEENDSREGKVKV